MKNIGFIGLGIMGFAMAKNIQKAGYQLHVWARKQAITDQAKALGMIVYSSAAEVAVASDMVITCVSDTPDVEAVILGEQGIIEGAQPGCVVVDMSTISPATTREIAAKLAEKNIDMLDAPVSGGDVGARNATLTIMAGGKPEVLARVSSVLQTMGKTITHIGDHGAGQVAKGCNQIMVGATVAAAGEALKYAGAQDVDFAEVRKALLGGFAQSRVMEIHGQRLIDNNFKPGFKAALHLKDMNIVMENAVALGLDLTAAQRVTDDLNKAVEKGDGELDSSVIARK
ncbi:NAD(P)-dependent oxidoreductase [Pelagibaculum spongiae]|uniref:2-hydroxy-3-oxopropionate reductase n=1 Tax=Pelagibaculum spongiae TaxID=2080658 RepID=A0A2V1GX80_9GAMM|nr:NAD(P)-dependent oxidoreductase [Pelagibaculum spongiae]PVZ70263.1 2-hydroxy-3-oxopropionate reductase [Pelagibaculum spongiae]